MKSGTKIHEKEFVQLKNIDAKIKRWWKTLIDGKKLLSRFRGKLVKMIWDAGGKFYNYSILPKIRHILLHWCYELTEEIFFNELTN